MPNAGGGGGVPRLVGSCLRVLGKGGRPEPQKRVFDKGWAAQGRFSQTGQALRGWSCSPVLAGTRMPKNISA